MKWTRKSSYNSHMRILGFFNAVVLSVTLSLVLAACGGTGGGAIDANSSSSGGTPNPSLTTPNAAVLAWDAVTATNLAGYRVYFGTAPGSYLQSFGQGLSVGKVTTYTLMGLSNGMRYYFAVTAIDASGNESVYSNETFKDIP